MTNEFERAMREAKERGHLEVALTASILAEDESRFDSGSEAMRLNFLSGCAILAEGEWRANASEEDLRGMAGIRITAVLDYGPFADVQWTVDSKESTSTMQGIRRSGSTRYRGDYAEFRDSFFERRSRIPGEFRLVQSIASANLFEDTVNEREGLSVERALDCYSDRARVELAGQLAEVHA